MESSLVPVLSFILTKMVERNDKVPLAPSRRTVFHAEKAPLISLPRYLERVLSFAPCSNNCFIIALIYIDRIIQSHADFVLNSLSVHRMLITSVMVATKFFDDETFNNLYYAKVGGLQVTEVNQLEQKFLSLINFSLTIQAEIFERYRCELLKHAKVSCIAKTSPTTIARTPSCEKPVSHAPTIPCKPVIQETPCPPPVRPLRSSAPAASKAPSLVRSVCEALAVESTKDKALQSRLITQVADFMNTQEKLHCKVPPSSINTLCAKLITDNNLSPSLLARASAQAERLERLEKMESIWYQSGYDYAGRDAVVPSSNGAECANPLDFGKASLAKSVSFSQCTPTYPNNSRHNMVAVTWG